MPWYVSIQPVNAEAGIMLNLKKIPCFDSSGSISLFD
jgi:hypothetical protein